jgi:hypothetical protein
MKRNYQLIALLSFGLITALQSCTNSCKDVEGKFSSFSTSLRYDYLFTYKFSNGKVSLMNTSRTGIGAEYKSGTTQEGTYDVQDDRITMNFGGYDVYLNINRSSDGCISSLSNDESEYNREE